MKPIIIEKGGSPLVFATMYNPKELPNLKTKKGLELGVTWSFYDSRDLMYTWSIFKPFIFKLGNLPSQ